MPADDFDDKDISELADKIAKKIEQQMPAVSRPKPKKAGYDCPSKFTCPEDYTCKAPHRCHVQYN